MSSEVLIGLIGVAGTAIGAVLGGVIALKTQQAAERDRHQREGRAFRRALRTDLLRWTRACLAAAEGRRTVDTRRGLTWQDIAAPSARFLLDGHSVLAFYVFEHRELSERAHNDFNQGVEDSRSAFSAQYALRRSAAMSSALVEWIDDVTKVGPCTGPFSPDDEQALASEFFRDVDRRLISEFGYRLNDNSDLLIAEHTDEEVAEALKAFARRPNGAAR